MKLRDLAHAAVRFYALTLIVLAVASVPSVVAYRWAGMDAYETAMFAGNLCVMAVLVSAIAFLLLRTDVVVRLIVPEDAPEGGRFPARGLGVLAFSVAGLVFLVRGLELAVRTGAVWYFSADRSTLHVRSLGPYDKAALIEGLALVAAGLWLLLGSRGILRVVRKLQRPPVQGEPTTAG